MLEGGEWFGRDVHEGAEFCQVREGDDGNLGLGGLLLLLHGGFGIREGIREGIGAGISGVKFGCNYYGLFLNLCSWAYNFD